MPIPQVNDRIKEAPVTVLRAVFAGIGQLLLTADKVRARAAEQVWPPDRAAAGRQASQKQGWPSHGKVSNGTARQPVADDHSALRTMPGSPGGTARTAPATRAPEPSAPEPPTPAPPAAAPPAAAPPAAAPPAAVPPAAVPPAAVPPAPEPPAPEAVSVPDAGSGAGPAPADPPLPGYDELSLPSLRARLRVLDAATIQAMLAYERAHAGREPVITMLERRLAKIAAD